MISVRSLDLGSWQDVLVTVIRLRLNEVDGTATLGLLLLSPAGVTGAMLGSSLMSPLYNIGAGERIHSLPSFLKAQV